MVSPEMASFQASPAVPDAGFVRRPNPSTVFRHPDAAVSVPGWTDKPVQSSSFSATRGLIIFCFYQKIQSFYSIALGMRQCLYELKRCCVAGNARPAGQSLPNIYTCSSDESTPRNRATGTYPNKRNLHPE